MPKLSEREKQEIIRLLENGEPLPTRCRFSLFEDMNYPELIWPGKSDEVCRAALPFQAVETVPPPSFCGEPQSPDSAENCRASWVNRLFLGDNRLVLSSLLNGPARKEIDAHGGIKLIYIDPPFNTGADFFMDLEAGRGGYKTKPRRLSALAYRDHWGKGAVDFMNMIHERLLLMRDLLADDGCIYVHCDWRFNSWLRLLLDEVFNFYINEICWHYTGGGRAENYFSKKHDTIFIYSKSASFTFNGGAIRVPYKKSSSYAKSGITSRAGKKYMPNPAGTIPDDVWDIPIINPLSSERLGYPTQKPEALLERIIKTSSNPGDIVADFFCGSGTLPAVAERLNRKWIAADSGQLAVHTARKRLLEMQGRLVKEGGSRRPFGIWRFAGAALLFNNFQKSAQKRAKGISALQEAILTAYGAKNASAPFHGEKKGRMVFAIICDSPVSLASLLDIICLCRRHEAAKADILALDFEPDLLPACLAEARRAGVDIILRRIPWNLFPRPDKDKKIYFPKIPLVEFMPLYKDDKTAARLVNFSLNYSPDASISPELLSGRGGIEIWEEAGQIVKVSKNKKGGAEKMSLTQNWEDWIDYWAVDFDFGEAQKTNQTGDEPEKKRLGKRAGNSGFTSCWQSYRARQNRSLDLTSEYRKLPPGERKIAVQVVDLFGNEFLTSMTISAP